MSYLKPSAREQPKESKSAAQYPMGYAKSETLVSLVPAPMPISTQSFDHNTHVQQKKTCEALMKTISLWLKNWPRSMPRNYSHKPKNIAPRRRSISRCLNTLVKGQTLFSINARTPLQLVGVVILLVRLMGTLTETIRTGL